MTFIGRTEDAEPRSQLVTIAMNSLIAILASILIVTCSLAAEGPDKGTPLTFYRVMTSSSLYLCKLKFRVASDHAKCIAQKKSEDKRHFDEALLTLKKPKAQDALKSYHVAYVAALEGIAPGIDERKISYEQRQQALEGKLTEAWARVEVEQ